KDERLFARTATARTPAFFQTIGTKLLQTNRMGMARCLQALGDRTALHKVDLMRLLAVSPESPSWNGKSAKRLYEKELAALEEIGSRVVQKGTALESVVVPMSGSIPTVDELATMAAADVRKGAVLARVLVEQLRRQNLLSWNRVEMPGPQQPYTVF